MSRVAVLAVCALVAAGPAIDPLTAGAAPYPQTDVMFLFDTSGSMGPVLEEAKAEIQQVMTRLSASLPSVEYGVAEVRDYPVSPYGEEESGEVPWKLDTPVTANSAAISEAIGGLSAFGGGDSPEAYGRALWETSTNPSIGWRPGARHLIVLVADEVPHDANVDEGIPEQYWVEPAPWNTGEELPGEWGIPGTLLKEGERLDFHSALRGLASDGTPLEMVDYHDTEVNYIHYWEYWASLGGGHALEAGAGEQEFARKLTSIVEEAPPPCATSAVPSVPSPSGSGKPPTALTPRFSQPGSPVVLTPPSGTQFCPGQQPYLGGGTAPPLEEATPSRITFRVPATASNGLELTNSSGVLLPGVLFNVDNFRYPWGFSTINERSDGGAAAAYGPDIATYDGHIDVTPDDLDSVFSGLGAPKSAEYDRALARARRLLSPHGGLCYGFSLLSWELYLDAYGQKLPLQWAASKDLSLTNGQMSYLLREASTGSHALTHALLRAALSQESPEARRSWHTVGDAADLESQLNAAFERGQPALLLIHWKEDPKSPEDGHALLAFDYQVNGDEVVVDVVDPNVPWDAGRPVGDYQELQVHVEPDGRWSYLGSFTGTFADPITPSGTRRSGILQVAPSPAIPGTLKFAVEGGAGGATVIEPGGDSSVEAIGYSKAPSHSIPADVKPGGGVFDAASRSLLVPASHHAVTVTVASPSDGSTTTYADGPGFLDRVQLTAGENDMTIESAGAAVSVPHARSGTTLSVTRITDGVQRTATAQFTGSVRRPKLMVTAGGRVTLTTAGGRGGVALGTATYGPAGEKATTKAARLRLHGRFRGWTHTPKVKRHRRCRRHHRCEGRGRSRRGRRSTRKR